MRPTISLLILPTRTISTISTVSSSVTRMPPTNCGSLPRRFMSAPICGPPPCTITGLRPTNFSRMTSSANGSLRSARSIAAPPYLMTTVFPRNSRMYGSASMRISARRTASLSVMVLQDVPRDVLVPYDVALPLVDVDGVDRDLLPRETGRIERDLLQELLHDRVEPPRTDVLGAIVHPDGELGDRVHRVVRERQPHPLGGQKLHVLTDEGVAGFGQNADEIRARQGVELDSDGESALELRDEIGGLGHVERAGRDEEDMVRADDTVFRRDRRALDDRQQVALHALTGHLGAVSSLAARHLVELVDEHDPGVLDTPHRLAHDLFHVDELLRFFLNEEAARLADAHAAALRARRHDVGEHFLEIDAHLFHALARQDFDHGHRLRLRLELDDPVVQTAVTQLGAKLLACRVARGVGPHLLERTAGVRLRRPARQQKIEHAIFCQMLGTLADAGHQLVLHHLHGELGEVADHRLHVAADITDLGVFRRFHFDERRLRELGQAPRDLRLSDAGWADHDDVLRRHLVAHLRREPLPPPAVAQRNGHRTFR